MFRISIGWHRVSIQSESSSFCSIIPIEMFLSSNSMGTKQYWPFYNENHILSNINYVLQHNKYFVPFSGPLWFGAEVSYFI